MGEPLLAAHVLREYALIADGERGALLGPKGDIGWICTPRWDSEAAFTSMMGGPGHYSVCPGDPWFVWGGYYEEGSLIWHSRWVTSTGIAECREALAFPADPGKATILRRLTPVDYDAEFEVSLIVSAGFGRHPMTGVTKHKGVWSARSGPLRIRWHGGERASIDRASGALVMNVKVPLGGHHDLVLEVSNEPFGSEPLPADELWRRTETAWAAQVPDFDDNLAPRDSRHAYAVLRGLTSSGGGMVAAATLGLPERAEAGRNYDYRYAWIRDQCFVGQAVAATGAHGLLDDAVRFVSQRVLDDGPHLKPAYRVDGTAVPGEQALDHLPGYPGGKPKIGNWVTKQFQLDALGEALLLFGAAGAHDHLDLEHWKAVEAGVEAIEGRWRDPDAGIWEIDNERWAHSRLMCAAGLRAVATLAPAAQASRWSVLADKILADAASDCVHPDGRWQRSPTDERIDAALLLPGIRGTYPPSDPRHRATYEAVARELGRDGYIYRFRHDARPLDNGEGAFLLCGFLMALAAHQLGKPVEARAWFERNRAACGPPGLFTEEFDVVERQLRGNFPQAFVHALLLESASQLARSQSDEPLRPGSRVQ
jgi:hypothetical protein